MNDMIFSVVIMTFNSEKFVIDTLESVKAQSYPMIQLILTDDCSIDNTIDISNRWISNNQERFIDSLVLTSAENQGIPSNLNKSLPYIKGEWVKIIAGDDALYPDALENAFTFINENKKVEFFGSSYAVFKNSFEEKNKVEVPYNKYPEFYAASSSKQYHLLLRNNYIHAPTAFLKRDLFLKFGGFKKEYRFLEDLPFWLKLTSNGVKAYYLDKLTVKYRTHENSIFTSKSQEKIFNSFYLRKREFEIDMIFPFLKRHEKLSYHYQYYLNRFFDSVGLNKKNTIWESFYFFLLALSPTKLIARLKNGIGN
jgi:glycosyltransferase involved in cell wall biosynthesis